LDNGTKLSGLQRIVENDTPAELDDNSNNAGDSAQDNDSNDSAGAAGTEGS
jgi:hypothetical protein